MLQPNNRDRSAKKICDIVRVMIVCDNMQAMTDVLKCICKTEDMDVVRFKDRMKEPASGWRDAMINFRVKAPLRPGPGVAGPTLAATPVRPAFDVGTRVRLHSLAAKPELNGKLAEVKGYDVANEKYMLTVFGEMTLVASLFGEFQTTKDFRASATNLAEVKGHICEVQIVHKKMLICRDKGGSGGHDVYTQKRAAREILKFLGMKPKDIVMEEQTEPPKNGGEEQRRGSLSWPLPAGLGKRAKRNTGGASTLRVRVRRTRCLACLAACLAACLPVAVVALLGLTTNLFELPLSRVALVSIGGGAAGVLVLVLVIGFTVAVACACWRRGSRMQGPFINITKVAPRPPFAAGTRVRLHSLEAQPQMNGKHAEVKSYDAASGEYALTVLGEFQTTIDFKASATNLERDETSARPASDVGTSAAPQPQDSAVAMAPDDGEMRVESVGDEWLSVRPG